MTRTRYTIAVDFDGVIHSYSGTWQGHHVIADPPVPGAIEWLAGMVSRFDVAIMSTRNATWRGRRAMRRWLFENDPDAPSSFALWCDQMPLGRVKFPKRKPPALAYIDDRALRFNGPGTFPTVDDVHRARPWNRPGGHENRLTKVPSSIFECGCCGTVMSTSFMVASRIAELSCPVCAVAECRTPEPFAPAGPIALGRLKLRVQSEMDAYRESRHA